MDTYTEFFLYLGYQMDAARIETLEKGMAYEQSREGPPPGFPKLPPIPAKGTRIRLFLILK